MNKPCKNKGILFPLSCLHPERTKKSISYLRGICPRDELLNDSKWNQQCITTVRYSKGEIKEGEGKGVRCRRWGRDGGSSFGTGYLEPPVCQNGDTGNVVIIRLCQEIVTSQKRSFYIYNRPCI